jgi:NADH:ubiquinone oxidoreductase subunit E
MPPDDGVVEIEICMGSSCFARGNFENLEIINAHLQNSKQNASVHLTGKLCHDLCKQGPNLTIGGVLHYGVTPARLRELLQQLNEPAGDGHGTA